MSAVRCAVCGAADWLPLPDPAPDRSITTAGNLLREPLSKAHCERCSLLQRIEIPFVGASDFYEERYADYYNRAGAATYDAPRYAAMAEWMCAGLGGFVPKSILDVGCGAGWSMLATRARFPEALIEGVEPSRVNAERARQAGFEVHRGKIGTDSVPEKTYDLVFANNVMQHVLSPAGFLTALRDHLSEQGLLVLICPDASRPSNEMLWCDHNHSFRPAHLLKLADDAGYQVRCWLPHPDNVTVLDKQLIVLARREGANAAVGSANVPDLTPNELYQRRLAYIEGWRNVHRHLREQTDGLSRTINFGSSSWTWLLAAYCPDYWSRVDCCTVDHFGGVCLDKAVKPLDEISASGQNDGLVLGINPVSQPAVADRFQDQWRTVVRWDKHVHS